MPKGIIETSLVILALLAYVFDMRGTLLASLAMLLFLALYHYIHKEDNAINHDRAAEKAEHLGWVLKAAKAHGNISNHEVQALLKVSHTTAERYLEELEREGDLEQMGTSGRSVVYHLKEEPRNPFLDYL
ncbi:hypothetical protein HY968_03730 [Candidatus Kaiserbacteria bacterium]|nr:hypothetical protein [Candidatus Kaiserbacteria bacterium]